MRPPYKTFKELDEEKFREEGKKRYEEADVEEKIKIKSQMGVFDENCPNYLDFRACVKDHLPIVYYSVSTDGMDRGKYNNHLPLELSVVRFEYRDGAYQKSDANTFFFDIEKEKLEANLVHNKGFDVFAYNGITRDEYEAKEKTSPSEAKDYLENAIFNKENGVFVTCNPTFANTYLDKLGISFGNEHNVDLLKMLVEYDSMCLLDHKEVLNTNATSYSLSDIFEAQTVGDEYFEPKTTEEKLKAQVFLANRIVSREQLLNEKTVESRKEQPTKEQPTHFHPEPISNVVERGNEAFASLFSNDNDRTLYSSKENDSLDVVKVNGSVEKVGEAPIPYAGEFNEQQIKKDVEEGKYSYSDLVKEIQSYHERELAMLSSIIFEVSKIKEKLSDMEQSPKVPPAPTFEEEKEEVEEGMEK